MGGERRADAANLHLQHCSTAQPTPAWQPTSTRPPNAAPPRPGPHPPTWPPPPRPAPWRRGTATPGAPRPKTAQRAPPTARTRSARRGRGKGCPIVRSGSRAPAKWLHVGHGLCGNELLPAATHRTRCGGTPSTRSTAAAAARLRVVHRHAPVLRLQRSRRRRRPRRAAAGSSCAAACCACCARRGGLPGVQVQVPVAGAARQRDASCALLAAQELGIQEAGLGGLGGAQQARQRRRAVLLRAAGEAPPRVGARRSSSEGAAGMRWRACSCRSASGTSGKKGRWGSAGCGESGEGGGHP